jgi:hypothetical protein
MYVVDDFFYGGMSGGGIFEIYINIRLADVDDDDVLMLESQEMNLYSFNGHGCYTTKLLTCVLLSHRCQTGLGVQHIGHG